MLFWSVRFQSLGFILLHSVRVNFNWIDSIPFDAILSHSIYFHSISFDFVSIHLSLFSSIQYRLTSFHCPPFHFSPFLSVWFNPSPAHSDSWKFIPPIWAHLISSHLIHLYSIDCCSTRFHFIPLHAISFQLIPFHFIPVASLPVHSIACRLFAQKCDASRFIAVNGLRNTQSCIKWQSSWKIWHSKKFARNPKQECQSNKNETGKSFPKSPDVCKSCESISWISA
jgi:hypothetical protein